MKWTEELKENISTAEELRACIPVSKDDNIEDVVYKFPASIPEYYLSLIDADDPHDPIRKMSVPSSGELAEGGTFDTSGESSNTVLKGMQHKYARTVLILSTNKCAMYCRYCFRKRMVGSTESEIADNLDDIFAYIKEHTEITNVLISGGDSFLLENEQIEKYLSALCEIDHLNYIRFGTKTPIVLPKRITEDKELLDILKKYSAKKQIYVHTQFNHPSEITEKSTAAVKCLINAGVMVKNQAVLLKGVNDDPEILSKLAQYELTLLDWIDEHRGYRKYVAIAGKCWPAFQTQFGFVPCYVNSRLTGMGIPVSCEVDIYGALSEFIGTVVSQDAVTLLDINNSVPADMYAAEIGGTFDYTHKDTFMAFHCGNTASGKLASCEMKYQKIMARTLPEEVTQGTLEGDIAPGDITFFRLQSTADNVLRGYIAQGEILPVATRSFGSIGVFAIPEMGRFYRHVLIEGNYPHHGAVAFGNYGKALYEVYKYIGVPVEEIGYNQPKGVRYPTENPWG